MMDHKWTCRVICTLRRHPMNLFRCMKSASWNLYCVESLCLTCFWDTYIYSMYQHVLLLYIPTSNLPLPHLDLGVGISWTWWSGHWNLTHRVSMGWGLYRRCSTMVLVPDAAWCSCIHSSTRALCLSGVSSLATSKIDFSCTPYAQVLRPRGVGEYNCSSDHKAPTIASMCLQEFSLRLLMILVFSCRSCSTQSQT